MVLRAFCLPAIFGVLGGWEKAPSTCPWQRSFHGCHAGAWERWKCRVDVALSRPPSDGGKRFALFTLRVVFAPWPIAGVGRITLARYALSGHSSNCLHIGAAHPPHPNPLPQERGPFGVAGGLGIHPNANLPSPSGRGLGWLLAPEPP
ncbi:hypothetical protein D9M69_630800 [compost metagenome]